LAIDVLVRPLLALPLFRGLSPLQLTEIVRRAERIIFRPGDALVVENDVADAAVVIISGPCVRIDAVGDRAMKSRGEVVPEGSMLAELAMLIDFVHTTTVIAQGPVKALRLTRERMQELMAEDPALAEHFSTCILNRLKLLANELKGIDSLMDGARFPAPNPAPAGQRTATQAI
jgi:CRP-like cAMP-binding protein